MKFKFIAAACLTLLFAFSCKKDDQPKRPNADVSFLVPAYGNWVYVDLETHKTEVREDTHEWTYSKISKKREAKPDNAPAKYHLAFCGYDVNVKDGEVLETKETSFDKIEKAPEGTYVGNKETTVYMDLTKMTEGIIGMAKVQINSELSKWVSKKGMPPVYTLNNHVFVIKFKDGKTALIQFLDHHDATGNNKEISFNFKFLK